MWLTLVVVVGRLMWIIVGRRMWWLVIMRRLMVSRLMMALLMLRFVVGWRVTVQGNTAIAVILWLLIESMIVRWSPVTPKQANSKVAPSTKSTAAPSTRQA